VYEASEVALRDELHATTARVQKLKQEVASSDAANEELTRRMEAECDTASVAHSRVEAAIREKEHVEQQLKRVSESHAHSLTRCEELEESEASLKSSILTLQSELAQSREECSDLTTALEEAAGHQTLAHEVTTLRAQLSEVRRKLAKRDIEEESHSLTPASVLEREKNNRRVYENLIDDLRAQLDRATHSLTHTKQKLSEATVRLLRVEELEEQVQIYKENSVKYSHESMW
jgi:chromosome segregation ATPase